MEVIYFIFISALIWFLYPFIKCAMDKNCADEHLKPYLDLFKKENK